MPREKTKVLETMKHRNYAKKAEIAKLNPHKRKIHEPYPWDQWFDDLENQIKKDPKTMAYIVLKKGKDFTCQLHSMATQCRMTAAYLKVKVSVSIEEDEIVIRRRRGIGV